MRTRQQSWERRGQRQPLDPASRSPEYKACAIRPDRAAALTGEFE